MPYYVIAYNPNTHDIIDITTLSFIKDDETELISNTYMKRDTDGVPYLFTGHQFIPSRMEDCYHHSYRRLDTYLNDLLTDKINCSGGFMTEIAVKAVCKQLDRVYDAVKAKYPELKITLINTGRGEKFVINH